MGITEQGLSAYFPFSILREDLNIVFVDPLIVSDVGRFSESHVHSKAKINNLNV